MRWHRRCWHAWSRRHRRPPNNLCPRPDPGTIVGPQPHLYSSNGVLNASFDYYTTVDAAGRTLFCFVMPDGMQSPTLHVRPGDTLNLSVINRNPPAPPGSPTEVVANASDRCGDVTMTITSLNVHFHGTNTSPACHSDQIVHTIINSGQNLQLQREFPDERAAGAVLVSPARSRDNRGGGAGRGIGSDITVYGATPVLFNPDNPPAIVTTQGAVEDWTIQNRSQENHEFHMHQIHFLLLERNGVPCPRSKVNTSI